MYSGPSVERIDLNPDLHDRLIAIGPGLNGKQVLLTPHIVREGQTHYTTQDVYAERDARHIGLDAAFAVPANERTFVGEFSAPSVISMMSMTVGSGLIVATVTGIVRYIKMRLGLDESPDHPMSVALPERHVRVTINRVHDQDGLPGVDSFAVEGRPDDVAEQIRTLLTPLATDARQASDDADDTDDDMADTEVTADIADTEVAADAPERPPSPSDDQ